MTNKYVYMRLFEATDEQDKLWKTVIHFNLQFCTSFLLLRPSPLTFFCIVVLFKFLFRSI